MRVLVVDDSAVSRRVIRRELEGGGFKVDEAHSGREALDSVRSCGLPDAITLDVSMAGLDGYETCVLLRSKMGQGADMQHAYAHLPILFVTGVDSLQGREKGFEAGATDFLTKPFEPGQLLAKITELLQPAGRWQGRTALVVDDSAVARFAVSGVLKRNGLTVLEAEDGLAGLELATAHGGEIDLVISDYMMPGIDGAELCVRLRELPAFKNVPVIMLSALSERSFVLQMFKSGATDYLIKPFAVEELLARVSNHLSHRLLNRQLAEKVAELERVSKAKNEFLAVTSHDIRSPLSGILGYLHVALTHELSPAERTRISGVVEASSKHLTDILDDLTALSRTLTLSEELQLEPLLLEPIVRECVEALQISARMKDLRIDLRSEEASGVVIAGEVNALKRITNNLLSNAIKFTPAGGRVSIDLTQHGQEVELAVSDTGVGIQADSLPGLFAVYTKESSRGTAGERGTGLGLSIVKNLVEKHQGRISVTSTPGQGSRFSVRLPCQGTAQFPAAMGDA